MRGILIGRLVRERYSSSFSTERIVVEIDIHADIVAGKTLGGVQLLDQVSRYWSLLREENSKRQLDYHQGEIHTVVYVMKKKAIEINVHVRTGLIYKISALRDYAGNFLGWIKIGTAMSEIWNRGLDFEYDDAEMSFFSTKFPGISLEPDIIDPLEADFPSLKVGVITIAAPEYIKMSNAAAEGWISWKELRDHFFKNTFSYSGSFRRYG